jgi:hypothetical protein
MDALKKWGLPPISMNKDGRVRTGAPESAGCPHFLLR